MRLTGILDVLRDTQTYRAVLRQLRDSGDSLSLGVLRAARPFVLSALARDWPAPIIYVTARIDRAYNVSEQIPVWLGGISPVHRFAEPAPFFYERSAWGDQAIRSRIETLAALLPEESEPRPVPPIIITSARALMQRTMPIPQFRDHTLRLAAGQRWKLDSLIERWLGMGYEPETIVVEAGTFTRRGGILDIFPPAMEFPLRIEFFDDEIDSLRTFDPSSQRSVGRLNQAVITPAREALPALTPPLAARLAGWFAQLPSADSDMTGPQADAEALASGTAFPFIEHYLPYLYEERVSLLDYAPADALIVVEDMGELRDTVRGLEDAALSARSTGLLAPDHPQPYLDWETLETALAERRVVTMGFDAEHDTEGALQGLLAPEKRFGGQIKQFLTEARAMRSQGDRVVTVTAQAARMRDLWREQDPAGVPFADVIADAPPPRTLVFVDGVLHEGWRLRAGDGELHLFSDAEIFGWSRPEPRRRKSSRKARTPEHAYTDFREGDFIVHTEYGIGRFAGLRRRTIEGVEREYLLMEFAGTDTLYVPIHQADRLTRYVGPDDRPPTLHKLGQADWLRVRSRAQKAAEDEARELLELYARRAAAVKVPVAPDTPDQLELEAAFPYVETEDQLKAVRAVKADMERSYPMDRLICGDVGYGKTEVALRAAFKAVMDGRQVAILVPTTILAQQHYDTFSRRLARFPVTVEMISRFRTPQEQARIMQRLEKGEVDIIIGTHRLVSGDIRFKNLGLVIIDEEQRFGVRHKEHLKRIRTLADVLTLTATPIPRTLYMSLSGVRDISMIQTAPEDRLPVITHVGPFDEHLVRQAVLRELERGGQIFVVHNRVQSIGRIHEQLERIVPEAKIAVAHGQMDERQLEHVMEQFGNGEFDLLISTSIIESGLDIPNANTLIVDRADWFGLAQLYQLRGRVGRSATQAYAYFFHPASNRLTEEARERLDTLAEYQELGSGYQIAMRDLELRGAGDILSTRQSGQVAAIGLHLYTQLLAQSVRKLKGELGTAEELPPAPPVSQATIIIDLPQPAYLPVDYVPEMALRLQLYRRIGSLTSAEELEAMREELRDRFGTPPLAVEGLLYQIEIKLLAQISGATGIVSRNGKIEVRLPYLANVNRDLLAARLGVGVRVTRTAIEIAAQPDDRWKPRLLDILRRIAESVRSQAGAHY
jgi:transcription-repair coupling factor (superfamily II helicase)